MDVELTREIPEETPDEIAKTPLAMETPEEREARIRAMLGPRGANSGKTSPAGEPSLEPAPIISGQSSDSPVQISAAAENGPESLEKPFVAVKAEVQHNVDEYVGSRVDVNQQDADLIKVAKVEKRSQDVTRDIENAIANFEIVETKLVPEHPGSDRLSLIRTSTELAETLQGKVKELMRLIETYGVKAKEVVNYLALNRDVEGFKDRSGLVLLHETGLASRVIAEHVEATERRKEIVVPQVDGGPIAQLVAEIKAGKEVLMDRYNVKGYVGEGGLFYVLRAYHEEIGRVVALKLPKKPEYRDALEKHTRILALLRPYPNIPDVLDANFKHEPPYVAEQFLEGKTLSDIIEETRAEESSLAEADATRWALQVLSALRHIHEKGIIHKDVKPDNVIIDTIAYLTDFNISDGLDTVPLTKNTLVTQTLSSTRVVDGFTDDYASPEQRRGKQCDKRSDLYSFAVMLFEMLTNEVPRGSDVDPRTFNMDIKNDYRAFFTRALKIRPEDRFQSAKEMSDAIEGIVNRQKKVRKKDDKYGGGSIFYSEFRRLVYVDVADDFAQHVLRDITADHPIQILDYALSPDKSQLVTIEKSAGCSDFRLAIVPVIGGESKVIVARDQLRDAGLVYWGSDGIYVYADGFACRSDFSGEAKKSWYRWVMNRQEFKREDVVHEITRPTHSPNRSYRLFLGKVTDASGLYVVSEDEKSLEIPLPLSVENIVAADNYRWVSYGIDRKELKWHDHWPASWVKGAGKYISSEWTKAKNSPEE